MALVRVVVAIVAVTALAFVAAEAQALNEWSSIGPESEPLVHSLVIDPNSSSVIYAGAVGEIWRTEDSGGNWTRIETPMFSDCEVRALAMDPRDSTTLYGGCLAVIKSTDRGRTWSYTANGMEDGGAIWAVWAIAIEPTDTGSIYAGTVRGTVFKSVDRGESWQKTGALANSAREIRSIVIDPASPQTLYAAGTVGGVSKSVNGGGSWVVANTGLPTQAVTYLAIDVRSPATLYAGTIGYGIFKTTDGAASWTEVFGPNDVGGLTFTVAELAIDPVASSTIYAAMGDEDLGVFQSIDAGTTWHRLGTGLPFYAALRALAVSRSAPSTVLVGSTDQYPGLVDGGVFKITAATCTDAQPMTAAVQEFAVPTASSMPLGIAAGPDCALWFTESEGNKIGRISFSGQVTEFAIPTARSGPARITAGPDGALWFTESDGNKIGRIATSGSITEFSIPGVGNSFPVGITTGPDGNLWFTEQSGHRIGRITPAGSFKEFLIPPLDSIPSTPLGITVGSDGNLWFSEYFTGRVGRITTQGTITLFRVEPKCCADIGEITAGPDGNVWFTERSENQIARISPTGVIDYFALAPPATFGPTAYGIAAGSDGALWFTEGPGRIGRITTTGAITYVNTLTSNGFPETLTNGPDGNIWFTDSKANKIGRVAVAPIEPPKPGRHRRAVRP